MKGIIVNGVDMGSGVEVLVSAMTQEPEKLIKRMNLKTDAVIVNQIDRYGSEEITQGENRIRLFHCAERGVGRSRNTAWMRAEGDILLFSDEDIVYDDGYEKIILDAFSRLPAADGILFNLEVCKERRTYYNTDTHRVRWYNSARYPTYALAIRRDVLLRSNVSFSLLFGGGAPYSNGEDSLFFLALLKKHVRLYAVPDKIGREEAVGESTWFHGYTKKFFFDRGVLFHFLYGPFAWLFGIRFILTKKSFMCKEIPAKQAWNLLKDGIRKGRDA